MAASPLPLQDIAAYWTFDDPQDTGIAQEVRVAKDVSGRGNDLTLATLPTASRQTISKVRLRSDCWVAGPRCGAVGRCPAMCLGVVCCGIRVQGQRAGGVECPWGAECAVGEAQIGTAVSVLQEWLPCRSARGLGIDG